MYGRPDAEPVPVMFAPEPEQQQPGSCGNEVARATGGPALPRGWERRQLPQTDARGRTCYFVDHNTQMTHWSPPAPDNSPLAAPHAERDQSSTAGSSQWSVAHNTLLPPLWTERTAGDGRTYYQNEQTETTQWEFPQPDPQPVVTNADGASPRTTHAPAAAKDVETSQRTAETAFALAGITDPFQIKQLKQRNQILSEVVTSERRYCETLEKVWEFYYTPLKERQGTLISSDDWKAIFSSFGSIASFQRHMLAELEAVWQQFSSTNEQEYYSAAPIANVLSKCAPFLRMYRSYVSNYKGAIATLKRLEREDNAFARFLEEQGELSGGGGGGADLGFYLIQPVQRLPRYSLLLKELIKYTPTNLEEGLEESLARLQADIDEHCAFINREAALDDNRAKVRACSCQTHYRICEFICARVWDPILVRTRARIPVSVCGALVRDSDLSSAVDRSANIIIAFGPRI